MTYSVASLAKRWGCSHSMLYNAIRAGRLNVFRPGGRLIRITDHEVERWESGGLSRLTDTDSDSSKDKLSQHGNKADSAIDTASGSVAANSKREASLLRSLLPGRG